MRDEHVNTMLACVEFDSVVKDLMCCVYGDINSDNPTYVEHFKDDEDGLA